MPATTAKAQQSLAEAQRLAKANEAIAIRPKRGRLTLLSRRLYNALLYHAQRQGVDKPVYTLALGELIGSAHFTSNNTELLKTHLRDMQATTIEWSTSAGGAQRWVSTQLIGTVTIEEPGVGRSCTITWRYPDEIRERLVKPMQYTSIMLAISSEMRSYAAAVMYELGARYLTSPGRLTMREDVVWWAAVLTGRSDIKEVDYRFLKRDVISKALAELDALCTEFSLELIEHKRGRKVEEIQFKVAPKAQQHLGGINDAFKNVFDLELVGKLTELGLKREDAQDIYATTDEGQLRSALEHVQQRLRSQTLPTLKSPAAYFKDALKKGYAGLKEASPQIGGISHQAKKPDQAPVTEGQRARRIRELWDNDRMQQARALYQEMQDAQQAAHRERFGQEKLAELAAPIANAWLKDGPASRIAASTFFRWLAHNTWPEEPTDKVLLDFALARGVEGM
ncbi:MAG: RepB family plasmid replication initiator protein [Burkholderiaceae bacterium]|nr:MAG: RepB family plasmid replication initiator protein [Burkholderiaceae bacterium]TBR76881.1 MAG: RepB family plasmid replication initiator protein [Burkholderiaceae bacterium]